MELLWSKRVVAMENILRFIKGFYCFTYLDELAGKAESLFKLV